MEAPTNDMRREQCYEEKAQNRLNGSQCLCRHSDCLNAGIDARRYDVLYAEINAVPQA